MMLFPPEAATLEAARLAQAIRLTIIEQSKRANVGHIGSALSIVDVIAALFSGGLRLPSPASDPDRDRLVLSKGHAALALYGALEHTGRLESGRIDSFCHDDGTLLGVHPEAELEGIDFCTGSLGQGLSIGAGAALAARLQESGRQAVVLLSDAELNEGSVWEAIMFAAHLRLDRLVAIIDLNGQQAMGYTREVLDLGDVAAKLTQFGWDVVVVDGHDLEALHAAVVRTRSQSAGPSAIVAKTTFGKGVSFMESKIEWHYLPLDDSQYAQAVREIHADPAFAEPS